MRSLKLNENWDIQSDSSGNILMADYTYSIAQNVANAVKLFTNDAYFDTRRGIPHFQTTLKRNPDYSVIRSRILTAALGVSGVQSARVDLNSVLPDGSLKGVIYLTLKDGSSAQVRL